MALLASVAAGALVPLAGACSTHASSSAPASAPIASITVGVSLPLTGAFSGVGKPLHNAVLVAAAQVNAAGGVLGRPVSYAIVDDSSDEEQSKVALGQLLESPIAAYLGPLASSQVLAVAPSLYARQIVEITSWATSPRLVSAQPPHDRYLFLTVPPDTLQGLVLARLMLDGVDDLRHGGHDVGGCHTAAFVHTDDAYGSGLAQVASGTFKLRGGTIASDDTIPLTLQQDYRTVAAHVIAAHPDCLALIAHAETGAQVQRDVRAAIKAASGDWTHFFVAASDAQYDADYLLRGQTDPADPKSDNATIGTYGQVAETEPDTPDYHAFEALYHTRFPGESPGPFAANQYDAAMLVALAIERAGSASDGPAIRDALFDVSKGGEAFGPAEFDKAVVALRRGADIDYRGASGNVDFSATGTVISDYIIWHVERDAEGKPAFVTIGRVPASDLTGQSP